MDFLIASDEQRKTLLPLSKGNVMRSSWGRCGAAFTNLGLQLWSWDNGIQVVRIIKGIHKSQNNETRLMRMWICHVQLYYPGYKHGRRRIYELLVRGKTIKFHRRIGLFRSGISNLHNSASVRSGRSVGGKEWPNLSAIGKKMILLSMSASFHEKQISCGGMGSTQGDTHQDVEYSWPI